jgi:nucleoside 2-deoxyribosyltransferase
MVHTEMDYSHISDFRDKPDLSRKIVNHDLKYIESSDAVVVIANGPSYDTAIEMFVAKSLGKKDHIICKRSRSNTMASVFFRPYRNK